MQIESTQYVIAAGAQYLMGENLELEVAGAILCGSAWHDMQPFLELKTQPRVCPVS